MTRCRGKGWGAATARSRPLALLAALLLVGLALMPAVGLAEGAADLGADNADSVAVVIGNKTYDGTVPPVAFADNDAAAMRDFLVNRLGFRDGNVILLRDATLNRMNNAFGTESSPQYGEVLRRVQSGRSNVFVYYSGHGVPDVTTGKAFLLPSDGNPDRSESGYPLDLLFRNLKLVKDKVGPSRQVLVMIDACFSGDTADGKALLSISAPVKPARPQASEGIIKLLATSPDKPANWDEADRLGLFTSRFLLEVSDLARDATGGRGSSTLSWEQMRRDVIGAARETAWKANAREQVPEIDEASLSLPVGAPLPAVEASVKAARDDRLWARATSQPEDEKGFDDYYAHCATCEHRREAMAKIDDLAKADQSRRDQALDDADWARLRDSGEWQGYLDTCKARSACLYRDIAAERLAMVVPRVPTPVPAQPNAPDAGAVEQTVAACNQLAVGGGDSREPDRGVELPFNLIDAAQAVPACRKAHDARPDAVRVTFALGRALDRAGLYREASGFYRASADAGDGRSMSNLGFMYQYGDGVEQDHAEALRWYRKAAEAGDGSGMSNLGFMFQHGYGVARDGVEASKWYRKAAEAGVASGMFNLGVMYEHGDGVVRDEAEASGWYRKAAEAGVAGGMNDLGILYSRGGGVERNDAEALRWIRKAAEAGNPSGMVNLGAAYELGQGTGQNYPDAFRWYQNAADAGDASGMKGLARLYEAGSGTPKDLAKAAYWAKRAVGVGGP